MILETTQLLNNARLKHNPNAFHIYKETHQQHPCSLWCSKTDANFNWLTDLGLALCSEYTYRYNKIHKCQEIISYFKEKDFYIPSGKLTPFVQCMPDMYKCDDAVEAYRKYYCGDKRALSKWTKREVPNWWK